MERAAELVAAIRDQLLLGDSPPTNSNYETSASSASAATGTTGTTGTGTASTAAAPADEDAAATATAGANATTSAETTTSSSSGGGGRDAADATAAAAHAVLPPPSSAQMQLHGSGVSSPSRIKSALLLKGRMNSPARRQQRHHDQVQRRLVQGRRAYSRQRHDVLPQSHRELYRTLLLAAAERRKRMERETEARRPGAHRLHNSEDGRGPTPGPGPGGPPESEEQARRHAASGAGRASHSRFSVMGRAQSNRSLASSGAGTATATIPELDDDYDDDGDDEGEGVDGGGGGRGVKGSSANGEVGEEVVAGDDDDDDLGEDGGEGEAVSDYEDAVQVLPPHQPADDPSDDGDDQEDGEVGGGEDDDGLPATPLRSTPRDRNRSRNVDRGDNDNDKGNDNMNDSSGNNRPLLPPFKMTSAGTGTHKSNNNNNDKYNNDGDDDKYDKSLAPIFPLNPGELRDLPNDASLTSINSSLCTSNLSTTGSNHSADGNSGNNNNGGCGVDDNISPPPTVGVGFMLLNSSSSGDGGTSAKDPPSTIGRVDGGDGGRGGGGEDGGGLDGRRLFPTTAAASSSTSTGVAPMGSSDTDHPSSTTSGATTMRTDDADDAAAAAILVPPPTFGGGPPLDPPPRPQRTTTGGGEVSSSRPLPFLLPPPVPPSSSSVPVGGGGEEEDAAATAAGNRSVATMGHSSLLLLCSHALRGAGGGEGGEDGGEEVVGASLPRPLSAAELNHTLHPPPGEGRGDEGGGDQHDDGGESSSAVASASASASASAVATQHQHQPMSSLSLSPQRHQRQRRGSGGSSSNNAGAGTGGASSNPNTPTRGRIQMFGSEYARFLSTTPFSPAIPRKKQSLMSSLARRSREANYNLQHLGGHAPSSSGGVGGGGGAFSRHHQHGGGGPSSSRAPPARIQNIEDKSDAALTGAVMDLVVTHGNEAPPRGYCRISQTSHGGGADLTANMGGVGVHLNVKKESSWDRAVQRPCVVSLAVIFPDRNEFVPPGFCVVRRYKQKSSKSSSSKDSSSSSSNNRAGGGGGGDANSPGGGASPTSPPTGRSGNTSGGGGGGGGGAVRSGGNSDTVPANLNFGTSGERVYLCYKRSRDGNPVTGVLPLQPTRKEPIPEGYTVLERTPRNYVADVNTGAGPPMFLAFRQRLANLEMLRPLPLVLAQYTLASQKSSSSSSSGGSGSGRRRRLLAYYCTGGTIVPSNAGKYHIMDRTAHPRVSPSSVATRISLVHSSPSADYKPSYNNWNLTQQVVKKENSNSSLPSSTASSGLAATRRDNRLTDSLRTDGDSSSVMTDNYLHTTSSDLTMSGDSCINQSSFEQLDDSDVSTYCGSVTSSSVRGGGGGNGNGNNSRHHPRNMSYSSSSTVGSSGPLRGAAATISDNNEVSSASASASATASANYSDPLREIQDASHEAMEFIPTIVDGSGSANNVASHPSALDSRIAVLNPILTACYTQHGGAAMVAVEGLSKLLNETDFFVDDKRRATTSSYQSSREDEEFAEMGENLTLLDLSVQVVCDVATSSARETHFGPCVEFASNALRYAGGILHNRTLGYILRLNLFVCYFGASVPTSSSWPETLQSSSCILSEFGGGGGGGGGGRSSNGTAASKAAAREEACNGSNTLRSSWTPSRIKSDPPLLLDRKSTMNTSRLAIGAPHASALAMRDMLTLLLSRLESAAASSSNGVTPHRRDGQETTVADFIGSIVSDLVDSSVHRVHVANFAQLALHQIQRGGGSELFWYDMTATCGRGLFGDDHRSEAPIVAFSLLASLTKVASGKIRRVQDTASFVPRDVASKLLSLELLLHYVKVLASSQELGGSETTASTTDESSLTLVYSIRRLVVPSLMSNAANGFDDPRVFRRILYIITALWANFYRRHLKVEIAVLFDQYMLRVLRMGPQVLRCRRNRLDQQLDVLTEVVRWFASPHDLLELFLNFDADDKSKWNVFQQMCSALCTLAEQCGEIVLEQFTAQKSILGGGGGRAAIGGGGDGGPGGGAGTEVYRMKEAARTLQEQALHAICHVVRSLKDASWHIYMMSSEDAHNSQINSNGSSRELKSNDSPAKGNLFAALSKDKSYPSFLSTPPRLSNSNTGSSAAATEPRPVVGKAKASAGSVEGSLGRGKTQSAIKPPRPGNTRTAARTQPNQPQRPSLLSKSCSGDIITERKKAEKTLDIAFEIVQEKGLKKALDYLIACNVLTPSARDVASFLRMHRDRLDPKTVGDFLGEGHRSDGEYWNLIRYHYVRATSFVDMNVEQGLRHFLTSSGFRLPGEAQQIDRVITTYAQCFWEDNAGDHSVCPFRNQETVFLLSFALIMLNTDLHRASADTSATPSRKLKKMTRQEFLSNLKGAVHSDDLSKDYVFALYDSIEAQAIKINHSLTIQNGAHILFGHSLSGGAHTKQNAASSNNDASPSMSYIHSTKSLTSGVKAAQEVLRGFALYEEPFLKFGNDATLSRSLVRKAVSSTWFHFHSIINAMLDSPQPDRQKLLPGLDILQSALGATILLDLKMERSAFIRQLARIKFIFDRGVMYEALHHDAKNYVIKEKYKEEAWYKELEESLDAPESTTSCSVRGIERVHALVREMRGSLQVDTRTISELHRVAHRIRNGAFLLKDNRSFIREGDLIKRCRNKRHITYRFFLFSDRLIYAHLSSTHDDFKIHEDLPLSAMKILDVDARKHHAFVIVHPTKSFTVIAPTAALKSSWIADIKDSVDKAIERYAKLRKPLIRKS